VGSDHSANCSAIYLERFRRLHRRPLYQNSLKQ
jgi:hypothetical protein